MKIQYVIATCAAMVSIAFAGASLGGVAGLGMSSYHGDDADDMDYALAWQVGVKAIFPLATSLDLAPELLFAARGVSYSKSGTDYDYWFLRR